TARALLAAAPDCQEPCPAPPRWRTAPCAAARAAGGVFGPWLPAEAFHARCLSRADRKSTILVPFSRTVPIRAPRHPPDRLRHRGDDRPGLAAGGGAQRDRTGRALGPGSAHGEQAAQATGPGRPGGRLPRRARRLPPGASAG